MLFEKHTFKHSLLMTMMKGLPFMMSMLCSSHAKRLKGSEGKRENEKGTDLTLPKKRRFMKKSNFSGNLRELYFTYNGHKMCIGKKWKWNFHQCTLYSHEWHQLHVFTSSLLTYCCSTHMYVLKKTFPSN